MTTCSSVTGTFSQLESWSAFCCRSVFPAFVTNMEGILHRAHLESYSSWKASGALGSTVRPLTITPSMSNIRPNVGLLHLSEYLLTPTRGWGGELKSSVLWPSVSPSEDFGPNRNTLKYTLEFLTKRVCNSLLSFLLLLRTF